MAETTQALNLSGSVKTQISIRSNISKITWNWSSQTVSIQFDVAWVFFGVLCGQLDEYKATECFCSHCSDSSCFQRSPDYCYAGDGARYVLVKHQNILNEVMRRCLQEQMLRGRKKMYACMGQTLAFLLELQCVTVMVSLRLLITSELETISLASEVSRCCSLSAVKVLRSNEGLMWEKGGRNRLSDQ